ncbi:molecular chaperone [Pseudomonas sp. NPDC088368]|uniref:fimbrial biogenesis chaperone n=1 Tax=Pseudomonas sp. NPDC088368 TaxID=3364453 RepID=UPI00382FB6CD
MKRATMICFIALLAGGEAQAVVSLGGTRLVFDGRFREATLDVSNPGSGPVLIQAWIENPKADQAAPVDLPFVLTPHLTQISAQGRQTLRVLYEGVGMPQDRESLLHLYVLEVPRRSHAPQQMTIAVRQRINVFYRPKGLDGDPADVPQSLRWQRSMQDSDVLHVRNPTAFHAALLKITFGGVQIQEDLMLEPFSERSLRLPGGLTRAVGTGCLHFKALTDYGGQRGFSALSQGSEPFMARLRSTLGRSSVPPLLNEKC